MRRRSVRATGMRRWLAVMGRLVLIVSLWHAPLPILHAHDADVDESSVSVTRVDHLVEYHADVPVNSHVDFGWHWHLIPPPVSHPCDESSEGDCPFCPHDSQASLPQAQSVATSIQSMDFGTTIAWQSIVPNVMGRLRCNGPEAATQFLETYLGSVSLGTLLRVARC